MPAGFYANVLSAASSDYLSNPDIDTAGLYDITTLKGSSGNGRIEGDLFVGWWKESLLHSTVYSDYRVVPWIKNTVSHLPLADGASPDSFIYSDNFGAVYTPATDLGVSSFAFPNTANPYSSVVFNQDRFYRVAHARIRLVQCGEAYAADYALACFQVRNNFTASADLIPMGGAYAKTCPELWDEGVADPWEQTRSDTNGDSIPDWWEKYARNNYSPDIDPSASIGWETIVKMKFGDNVVELPAGKAYIIDLYRGMQPGGDIDPAYASNVDADANGIPDWWENLFGVAGHSGDDDVDSDGLSNYAEYLFSFGPAPYGLANGYPLLDPANQRTGAGQKVTDYFLAAPADGYPPLGGAVTNVFANTYLGAIATDHDFMEDWWESNYSIGYANPRQYDPLLDRDEDGWSNWAEAKAFNWYNTFTADIIDAFYTRKEHRDNHPKPAVGVRLTYYGQQNIREATAIVRTSNGSSQRMDSKFVIPSIGLGTYQFVGGIIVNSAMHGYLTPGYLLPHSVCFYKVRNASINNYIWTWEWYEENKISHPTVNEGSRDTFVYYLQRWPHIYLTAMDANWGEAFARGLPNSDGSLASIVHTSTGKEIGLVNLVTGEWELDTTLLAEVDDDPDTLSLSVLRIGYDRRPGLEWPKTFWLSDTESNKAEDLWELETGSRYDLGSYGYIKEGKNTVEAFIDLDADGAYTAGEPYGVVKDVDVGWHKTAEVVIELKDTTSIVPRINLVNGGSDRAVVDGAASSVVMGGGASESEGESGDSAGNSAGVSKTVRIIRTAINGQESRARQVMAHTYVLDDRPYIMEADVLSEAADRFDLDWKFLAEDAMLMDTTPISAAPRCRARRSTRLRPRSPLPATTKRRRRSGSRSLTILARRSSTTLASGSSEDAPQRASASSSTASRLRSMPMPRELSAAPRSSRTVRNTSGALHCSTLRSRQATTSSARLLTPRTGAIGPSSRWTSATSVSIRASRQDTERREPSSGTTGRSRLTTMRSFPTTSSSRRTRRRTSAASLSRRLACLVPMTSQGETTYRRGMPSSRAWRQARST